MVKQSVFLSSVIIVVTKIATSRVLCIWVCCNYHKLVDKVKSWFLCTSNCWTSLTSTTNWAFFVQHACGLPTTPTPCADLTLDCACSTSMQEIPKSWNAYSYVYSSERNASMLAILHYNGWRASGVPYFPAIKRMRLYLHRKKTGA